jgi:hypothetical protein
MIIADATIMATTFGLVAGDMVRGSTCTINCTMNAELTYRRLTTIGGHPDSSVIGDRRRSGRKDYSSVTDAPFDVNDSVSIFNKSVAGDSGIGSTFESTGDSTRSTAGATISLIRTP